MIHPTRWGVGAHSVIRVVLGYLRGMVLGHECGLQLTGANIAGIEAETAAGPSHTYG